MYCYGMNLKSKDFLSINSSYMVQNFIFYVNNERRYIRLLLIFNEDLQYCIIIFCMIELE